jgi:hypothetical protein
VNRKQHHACRDLAQRDEPLFFVMNFVATGQSVCIFENNLGRSKVNAMLQKVVAILAFVVFESHPDRSLSLQNAPCTYKCQYNQPWVAGGFAESWGTQILVPHSFPKNCGIESDRQHGCEHQSGVFENSVRKWNRQDAEGRIIQFTDRCIAISPPVHFSLKGE